MVEKNVFIFEEPEEPTVFPYLKIDGILVPVTIHSTEEIEGLTANGKTQLLLVNDKRSGERGQVVSPFDPSLKLKDGQGFDAEGIIWQETKAVLPLK